VRRVPDAIEVCNANTFARSRVTNSRLDFSNEESQIPSEVNIEEISDLSPALDLQVMAGWDYLNVRFHV
jgi:hypothetical protein